MTGIEDKRQVTVVVSSSADGDLLPFQIIFSGKSTRSLPPSNKGRQDCESEGWHVTHTENHWSNLETSKDFVDKILEPYRMRQTEALGLPCNTPLVWLIDCWKVHTCEAFTSWVNDNHPKIKLLYILANCI